MFCIDNAKEHLKAELQLGNKKLSCLDEASTSHYSLIILKFQQF